MARRRQQKPRIYLQGLVQLDQYMRSRAKREGVGWAMDMQFLGHLWETGCREFFGVELNDDGIISDWQQPDLLAEWRRLQ